MKKPSAPPTALFPDKKLSCSEPLRRFFSEHYRNIEFFLFVVTTCSKADRVRITAAETLLKITVSDEEKSKYQKTIEQPNLVADKLRDFAWMQSRNLVLTTVNTFLCYFSEIIQAAMLKRHDLLKSSQQITIGEILQFRSHSEMVSYLVDKKVNELSYGGIKEMESYFRDRLGVEVFQNDEEKNLLNIFVELRNIYTHNSGRVNRLFLSRVQNFQGFSFHLGKRYHIDFEEFERLAEMCIRIARNIDAQIVKKFRLKKKSYGAWTEKEIIHATNNKMASNASRS